ncbi:MAG: VOC family protein [Alphaproteobacteria bacterium]|jgi:catechol 2,3-dioxygenase-like lactoylglutathione lyase family enzyme
MDKIHHIAIVVPEIKKALEWYQNQFEIETCYADESWALVKFDNIELALVLPGQHPPHIAIECNDAELYGCLMPHRDGTASVYTNDPWGNVIEMLKIDRQKMN